MIKSIQFLFYTNLLLAISAFSFIWSWNLRVTNSLVYASFTSLGILLIYNLDAIRQFHLGMKAKVKKEWFETHLFLNKTFVIISFLGLLFLFFFWREFLLLESSKIIVLIALYIFYSLFNGRQIPMLKMWIIAFSWAFAVGISFNSYDFFKLFILFLALAIFSDCKDVEQDEKQLHTLPQVIGLKASKWLGLLFYTSFVMLQLYPKNLFVLSIGLCAVLLAYLLLFCVKFMESKFVSLVDSTLIILSVALLN